MFNSIIQFIWILLAVSFLIGFLLIIPIGGADMPVVISMLNFTQVGLQQVDLLRKYSFDYNRALVGSEAILSYIMCKGMDKSFNARIGGFGATDDVSSSSSKEQRPVKSGNATIAFLMKNAYVIIIVPGYGMAVAQITVR